MQINFTEVRCAGTLDADFPESGLRSVFCDLPEQPWGFDPADADADACALKLIFSEGDAALERRPQPSGAAGAARSMPARPWPANCMPVDCMSCVTAWRPESAQWGSQGLALDEEPRDRFVKWWFDEAQNAASNDGEDGGCLRIGGRPTPFRVICRPNARWWLRGIAAVMATSTRTRPRWLCSILQRSGFYCCRSATMKKGGMGWAGLGWAGLGWRRPGLLWMRRDDLRARRFDRVRLALQCC